MHSSAHTVGYGTAQQMPRSWAYVDQVPLPITPTVSSETLSCAVFHSQIVAPSVYTDWGCQYYALENVLKSDYGTLNFSRRDLESCRQSEHNYGLVVSLYGVCFFQLEMESTSRKASHVKKLELS
ncbi:hypothetical protein TNCV_4269851 [Trichonephila clavipes]|nr:hypothetical protein TNCV_4269851 [Trichonephila clavipes]